MELVRETTNSPKHHCMRGTCNIVNFLMSEFVSILVHVVKYISLTTVTVFYKRRLKRTARDGPPEINKF